MTGLLSALTLVLLFLAFSAICDAVDYVIGRVVR